MLNYIDHDFIVTATLEYSCPSLCPCICFAVHQSVYLCTIKIVVCGNSWNEFDIGHCLVKVMAQLNKFFSIYHNTTVTSYRPISAFAQCRKL